MYKEVFKIRVAARREELGLKQGQVGIETEIGQSKISKYETGNLEPNLETLGKLANYYEVSIDWLLGNIHNGKEGNLIKAAIEEFYNDVIETIKGADEQNFSKEETMQILLEGTAKKKNAIIEKYTNS